MSRNAFNSEQAKDSLQMFDKSSDNLDESYRETKMRLFIYDTNRDDLSASRGTINLVTYPTSQIIKQGTYQTRSLKSHCKQYS